MNQVEQVPGNTIEEKESTLLEQLSKPNYTGQSIDPADALASHHKVRMTKFRQRIEGLSSKAMRRLVINLLDFNIPTTYYGVNKDLEAEMFKLGFQLLELRMQLLAMSWVMKDKESKKILDEYKNKENSNGLENNESGINP